MGIHVTGPIDQPHIRPWSTVLRAPTGAGDVFFKATAPVLVHEAALTQALSQWHSDCMPHVLAADLKRGWMLMSDGGRRLREVLEVDRDVRHWETLMPIYAEVQMELAGRLDDLLALSVPDRRVAKLPTRYKQLLADREILRIDLPGGIPSAEYRRLNDFTSQFAAMCERLANYRVPDSLHHGDFHDGNIFASDGRYVFFDWGDASVSHPFFSLRTTHVSLEYTLKLAEGSPVFEQISEAYLEPWTKYETKERLLAAFKLAQRLWSISSALSWHRAVSSLEGSLRDDYCTVVPSLLQEFLGANRAPGLLD